MKFILKYAFVLVSLLITLSTTFYLKEDLENLAITVLTIGLTAPISTLILRGKDLAIIKNQQRFLIFDKCDVIIFFLILIGSFFSYSTLFVIIFVLSKILSAQYLINYKLVKLQFLDSLLISLCFNISLLLESKNLLIFNYTLNLILIVLLTFLIIINFRKIYYKNIFHKVGEKNEFFTTILHMIMLNSSTILVSIINPMLIYEAKLIHSGTNLVNQLFLPQKNYIKHLFIYLGKKNKIKIKSIFYLWIKATKAFYFTPVIVMVLIIYFEQILHIIGLALKKNLIVIFNKYITIDHLIFSLLILIHLILPPSGFVLFGNKNGIKNLISTSVSILLTLVVFTLFLDLKYISAGYFVIHLIITNYVLVLLSNKKDEF